MNTVQNISTDTMNPNTRAILEVKIKQLQYESNTWKRLLAFITEEDIFLKNRISEILNNDFNKNYLNDVENFVNKLVEEDQYISLLNSDLANIDKQLQKEVLLDASIIHDVETRLKKLRSDVTIIEKKFSQLKLQLNSYLSELI